MSQVENSSNKFLISGGVLALALGTTMGVTPANATLIITAVNTDVSPGSSLTFGPNGDEFRLDVFASSGCGSGCGNTFNGLDIVGLTGTGSTNLVAKDGFLRRYSPGDVVDGSANFQSGGEDPFKDPGTRFYGLDIIPDEVTLTEFDPFGFVSLDVNIDGTVHVNEFAFEDNEIEGAPIPGVPEPGTLSLLAVGAATLLAARRRKKTVAI